MSLTNNKPPRLVAAKEENQISRKMLVLLNQYPNIPSGVGFINFEFLKDDVTCMALSTIQSPYIVSKYITGGYEAEYQFKIIYRVKATSDDKRLKADETLNEFGDWLTEQRPDLGDGLNTVRIEANTRSSMFGVYENGDEDHQILMKLTYEVI